MPAAWRYTRRIFNDLGLACARDYLPTKPISLLSVPGLWVQVVITAQYPKIRANDVFANFGACRRVRRRELIHFGCRRPRPRRGQRRSECRPNGRRGAQITVKNSILRYTATFAARWPCPRRPPYRPI